MKLNDSCYIIIEWAQNVKTCYMIMKINVIEESESKSYSDLTHFELFEKAHVASYWISIEY